MPLAVPTAAEREEVVRNTEALWATHLPDEHFADAGDHRFAEFVDSFKGDVEELKRRPAAYRDALKSACAEAFKGCVLPSMVCSRSSPCVWAPFFSPADTPS